MGSNILAMNYSLSLKTISTMKTYNLVDLVYDIQTAEIPFHAALIIASTPKKYVIISGNEYTATDHPKQALRRIPGTSTIDQTQAIKIVNAKEYQEYMNIY